MKIIKLTYPVELKLSDFGIRIYAIDELDICYATFWFDDNKKRFYDVKLEGKLVGFSKLYSYEVVLDLITCLQNYNMRIMNMQNEAHENLLIQKRKKKGV